MKIECLTTFLHGRERFEQGDTRSVSDADGSYFVGCGWAKAVGDEATAVPSPADTVLDVQNATISHEVTHG